MTQERAIDLILKANGDVKAISNILDDLEQTFFDSGWSEGYCEAVENERVD